MHSDSDDEGLGRAYDGRIVARLLPYLAPYKGKMAMSIVMMVITAGSYLAGPYLVKVAIDQFITAGDLGGLNLVAGLYILNGLASWGASYGQIYYLSYVGQNILYQLRLDLFRHIQGLSLDFFAQTAAGRIMSRIQNDVSALNDMLTTGLIGSLSDLLTLGGIIIIMFTMDVRLSVMTFTVLPLMIIITLFWRVRARDAYRRVRRTLAFVNASLQENISGVRVIQALSREDRNLAAFGEVNQRHLDANLRSAVLSSAFFPSVDITSAIAMALVIGLGGMQVLRGELTAGVLVAFTLYIGRFFDPIRDLSQRYNVMQSAMASGERIFELLDTQSQVVDSPGASDLPRVEGRVDYQNVDFSYTDGKGVLHNINLLAKPGETIALVGRTGAGKTSLISLLARFYDVKGGEIKLDDTDLRQLRLHTLRSHMGIVLQEPFLFSGTVRENIQYGRLEASEEEIVAAAKAVGAHDFIMGLENGYDTPVQEQGSKLSMGQRQLISFARAILADPRILILDEATNSVDPQTEAIIQRALHRLTNGRTSVIIAHRLSTVKNADRIVVLEAGRVIEVGSHVELLACKGLYYDLYTGAFATKGEEDGRRSDS
ncbi:MAG: ABC transporter ATP-binding protein [Dehalococcoidia bacterium]|nr:ABC transporter ATP-binding protein [Dehalococcoidia bacterium]